MNISSSSAVCALSREQANGVTFYLVFEHQSRIEGLKVTAYPENGEKIKKKLWFLMLSNTYDTWVYQGILL